jgi:hypothetical protein
MLLWHNLCEFAFFVKKLDIFERAIDKNIIFAAKYQTTNI